MFDIQTLPIDPIQLRKSLFNDTCGAFVSFEGWVRNHNDNKAVSQLFYDYYPELAKHTGAYIIAQALKQFDIEKAVCFHRVGELDIGDIAVWVGVSAAHRDAAFLACRFIIDTVKQDVAIWKREQYVNQTDNAVWLAK